MTVPEFEMKIGAQLSRLEQRPRYFIYIQKWEGGAETYSFTFYPETTQGKIFYDSLGDKSVASPGLLIDELTVRINNFLGEYVIPNSKEVEI